MAGPERTCVACRESAGPDELIRLVRHPETGEVFVDLAGKLPGRGAWLHPRDACLTRLEKQKGRLQQAFKAPTQLGDLRGLLHARITAAMIDGLGMASASGSLTGGHDRLCLALEQGAIAQVLVASDASPRTLASIEASAPEGMIFVRVDLTAAELGERVGKGARAALGVHSTRGATHLRRQLRRLRDLG